jgi:stearoyl-CoA desaturase (delta-9 desaturase)
VAIALFFVVHWQASVFLQSFFHHRYGAHRQFTMSKGWERFFHLLTYVVHGSSYLSPRAYAIMHRMHHAYSDTPKDPHSPTNHRNLFVMMSATLVRYTRLKERLDQPAPRFDGGYPEWRLLDHYGASWPASIAWGALYVLFYLHFASAAWMYALLPIHWLMGPVHGAIVNWCGHRYGYRNFASDDVSRNTLVFDVLTMGELFQNNHHKFAMSPSFAARWFEVDPAYQIMKLLHWVRVIDMSRSQVMRWEPADRLPASAPAIGGE